MNRMIIVVLFAVFALVAGGCTGSDTIEEIASSDASPAATVSAGATDDPMADEDAGGSATGTESASDVGEPAAEESDESPDASATEQTPTGEDPSEPDPSVELLDAAPALSGVPVTIEILTPSAGGGIRPDLSWTPVPDAASYELVLFSRLDEPYWAWSGTGTSVPVGGEPRLGPNSAGAALIDDMRWFVMAFDADGLPLAQSPIVSISP